MTWKLQQRVDSATSPFHTGARAVHATINRLVEFCTRSANLLLGILFLLSSVGLIIILVLTRTSPLWYGLIGIMFFGLMGIVCITDFVRR